MQQEVWVREVLRQLEARAKPLLASLLTDVSRWEFHQAEVRILLADNGLAQVLPESDRQLLAQLLAEIMGRRVRVKFVDRGKGAVEPVRGSATGGASGHAQNADAASVEARVRSDPEVREFENLFGKPVTGIRKWKV